MSDGPLKSLAGILQLFQNAWRVMLPDRPNRMASETPQVPFGPGSVELPLPSPKRDQVVTPETEKRRGGLAAILNRGAPWPLAPDEAPEEGVYEPGAGFRPRDNLTVVGNCRSSCRRGTTYQASVKARGAPERQGNAVRWSSAGHWRGANTTDIATRLAGADDRRSGRRIITAAPLFGT